MMGKRQTVSAVSIALLVIISTGCVGTGGKSSSSIHSSSSTLSTSSSIQSVSSESSSESSLTPSSVASSSSEIISSSESSSAVIMSSSSVTQSSESSAMNTLILPANIESEDYDRFLDKTPENIGGDYRNDSVDIDQNTEGGFHISYTEQGEWLEYDFALAQAVDLQISARVASKLNAGQFQLLIDGVTIANWHVPNTQGWQTWTTLPAIGAHVSEGAHTLRMEVLGGEFNIDKVIFSESAGEEGSAFKVMSFNLRIEGAGGDDGEKLWDNRKAEVVTTIQHQAPAVIGFQEKSDNQHNYVLQNLGSNWRASQHGQIFYDANLLAIVDNGIIDLVDDIWGDRTAEWVKFATVSDQQTFVFLNNHWGVDANAQNGSAGILRDLLPTITNDWELPTVLLGDLNVEPASQALSILLNETPLVSNVSGPTFNGWSTTATRQLDYILTNKLPTKDCAIIEEREGNLPPSDHFPIVCQIQLTPVSDPRFTVDKSRGEWSLIVVPDTQHYSQNRPTAPIAHMWNAFDWIVSVKDSLNVQFVQGLGDITETWDNPQEWKNSTTAWYKLFNQVAFMPIQGNHDSPASLNQYFPVSSFNNEAWWGGDFGGIENNYALKTIGNENYLFLQIEAYDQYSEYRPAGLAWAKQILAQFPNKKVILATHDIWATKTIKDNLLTQFDNIVMANAGHDCVRETLYLTSGPKGGVSHNFVSDFQCDEQEVMLLRYYVFKPLEDKVDYFTYSPITGQFETDSDSMGSFSLIQADPAP